MAATHSEKDDPPDFILLLREGRERPSTKREECKYHITLIHQHGEEVIKTRRLGVLMTRRRMTIYLSESDR